MTTPRNNDSPSPEETSQSINFCRTAQIVIILIALLLHTVFLSKAKPLQSANDRSRWCTVWSLIERHTFQIDEIRQRPGWDTIDLVHVDDHFYSTKPPLLTSVVAGITWCVQRICRWTLIDHPQQITFAVLFVVNLIPFAVSLFVWIAILERITSRIETRLFAVAIAAFGTLLSPFLMTLNNHTVAAASVTVAIYALLKILSEAETRSGWSYAFCGFTSAWAAANELPAALLVAIAFFLAYRRSSYQTMTRFLPSAAIPIVALIVTNMIATGSWKPVYADYGTDKYRFVIDGVPSYWSHPQGIDRNLDSPWIYFVNCTVGHHGLFSLTPIALFAVASWLIAFRLRDRSLRTLLWVGALTTGAVLAFYMSRTQNYNYGGVSCGLRWALWLTPLWLIAIVPILDLCVTSKFVRAIAIPLALVSGYSAWQPIDNPWRQPWLFQWMESRGWIDYSEPVAELPRPLWSWFATLPEPVDHQPAWIEFTAANQGFEHRVIRMTARPDPDRSSGERVLLEIRETFGETALRERIRTVSILANEFNKGSPPADFLRWSDPSVTPAQQQSDLAFVRGLPRKVPYGARGTRYLKTDLRREALNCTLAAAHVAFADKEGEPPKTYRCDTWLSDDVPFGVAQVEFHVSDPVTGATLFHEHWTVRDCSPKVLPYHVP